MSSIYSIYKATNTTNGKVYIGFDSKWPSRKRKHKNVMEKCDYNFHKALKKYGWDNFVWEIIYQSKDKSHCLKFMEPYFINEYNSFIDGYNMTLGGDGNFGLKHTEETKRKISKINKGNKYSEGRILSQDTKNKISKSLIGNKRCVGRKMSIETRNKISETKKLKRNSIQILL